MYGYKVLYVPTAVMYHEESGWYGSKSSFQPLKVYLITRNRLYNILKNFEAINVFKGFLISVGFDTYRSIKYALNGYFTSIKAITKAYIDFAKNLRRTLKKRKDIQKNRRRGDKELYELGVIATLKESIWEEKRLARVWKGEFYRIHHGSESVDNCSGSRF
jgi:GT2 family glycosyltransferase